MATQSPDIDFQLWESSVTPNTFLGSLDVSSSKDFPIALTFSIKDVMDITKSKGSFSKTFKIPATENNNDILKNVFADGFYDVFEFIDNKIAKIYFNSQLIMEGGFKIKATVIDSKPLEYECLVFGENYKWVNELDRLNLCDIDWSIGNMFDAYPTTAERTFDSVEETWKFSSSDHLRSGVGTHFVYPLVNRGKWNNLNKVHYTDLIPAFWVRNLVYQITLTAGYTLVSNFMDSEWFKRLLTLFPVADDVWEQTIIVQADNAFNGEVLGPTEWKIPIDYREPGIGNRFDGALLWGDTQWTAPNFNTNSQWYPKDFMPSICDRSMWTWDTSGFYGGNDLSTGDHTISGWFWDQHGGFGNYIAYGQSMAYLADSPCCPPRKGILGQQWDECWTWSSGYCAANALPECTQVHEDEFVGVCMFAPTVADEYTFNGEFVLEMDNDYVIDNEPLPYSCGWGLGSIYGGGFNYEDGGWWHDDPAYGTGFDVAGVYYSGQIYLAWAHASSEYTEFIRLDTNTQTSINYGGNWFYNGYFHPNHSPLPPSPGNLTFPLSFSNVLVNVTDVDDRFYYYCEVNEELHTEHGMAGLGIDSYVQCKYRIRSGYFDGGLTSSSTTSTVTDINISSLLPCKQTQLDYVNGLTGLFNLYWSSDEENKILYCEPRDDFFFPIDQSVDWSLKLDFKNKQTSKFIYDALNRDLCFTYQDDGADGFVGERNLLTGQVCSLYSYAMDLGSLYKDAESKIGTTVFAPSYMFRDKSIGSNQGKSPWIPVIHSEYQNIWNITNSNDFPDKLNDFMPRILLWAGMIPCNKLDGPTSQNTWSWCQDNPVSSPTQKKHYPAAMMFYDEDEQFFPTLTLGGYVYHPTLPYNNVEANRVQPVPIPPAVYPFCEGLYDVFWERTIENLLQRPRLKKAKFLLSTTDIANLDLRKLVYLETGTESTYWIINKIIDYKPGKNLLTSVELYQFIPATPLKKGRGGHTKRTFNSNLKSVTRDFVTGQGRLAIGGTNMNVLGNQGGFKERNDNIVTRIQGSTSTNPNENVGNRYQAKKDAGESVKGFRLADGGSMPIHQNVKVSTNYGRDNLVQQNSGITAIGNNLTNLRSDTIYLGYGSGTINPHPIQFVQSGHTALAIDGSGNLLEGGGGAIMALDASGNYFEVYSENNVFGDITVKKILKSQ